MLIKLEALLGRGSSVYGKSETTRHLRKIEKDEFNIRMKQSRQCRTVRLFSFLIYKCCFLL